MGKKSKRAKILNMQRKPTAKQQVETAGEENPNTTYFVHGPRGIQAQKANGEWKHMVQDGLNSVRSVVDNDVVVHQNIVYDPLGNPINVVGPEQTMYGYTGEPTDATGLVHLRERYYNPNIGTFISQDPYEGSMNDPMSLNRYSYVYGNPINMTDPSGMIPVQAMNNMIQSNPLAFAQMMNTGMCFAQIDPCAGYAGQGYIDCRRGLLSTLTPFPGTPSPATFYVRCDFTGSVLNVRRDPSALSPIINIVSNPAGIELQTTSFIPGDFGLGGSSGTGWLYVNGLGGWVYNGVLVQGASPCPRTPVFTTPTPQPTIPGPTSTPGRLTLIQLVV